MMRLACVLKSGGGFTAAHVGRLRADLAKHLPDYSLFCLSDVDVPCERVPFKIDWPGWWAKMSLFRPDLKGDLLFFDLDTVIVRNISHFADVCRTTMLTDFLRETDVASGMMYLPEEMRGEVWDSFMRDPALAMRRHNTGGDQSFLREHQSIRDAARWQRTFPGQVVSYKVHIKTNKGDRPLPPDARVVCFHGQPRPWQLNTPWVKGGFDADADAQGKD
jgi:hypothetical protein